MSHQLFHGLSAFLVLLPGLDGSLPSKALGQSPRMSRGVFISSPVRTSRVASGLLTGYQLNSIYDRSVHQTRLSLQTFHRVERTPDGASVSFSVSATYPGRDPSAQPDSVEFAFTTFSPIRRGWAVGHGATLEITVGDMELVFPCRDYAKMGMRLGDQHRSERLTFRVGVSVLTNLAGASGVELKLGRFRFKIDGQGLDGLRAFARRLTPAVQ